MSVYTRDFSIMQNVKVTGIHSNIYTNIIFIGMGVKITVHTRKYPETLFIFYWISEIFLVSPWIIRVSFFSCILKIVRILLLFNNKTVGIIIQCGRRQCKYCYHRTDKRNYFAWHKTMTAQKDWCKTKNTQWYRLLIDKHFS